MRKSTLVFGLVVITAMACSSYAMPYGGGYATEASGAYVGGQGSFGVDLDIGYCYNYLAPYGTWVQMDPYGYVWYPGHMRGHWRPYSEGHWVWTDFGWTWVSDEDWGWMAFHYGRWGWDDDSGWFWVPGTVWGPAWVSWRYNDQYCGWAPLPPGFEFQAGVGFGAVNIPGRFWVFVQAPHFLDRDISSRVLPYERNTTIINYTSVHNNIYVRDNRIVNEGIGVDQVRRFTGKDVTRYSLRDVGQPGRAQVSGHEVQMYRPAFRENPAARPNIASSRDNTHRESAPAPVVPQRQQPQPQLGKGDREPAQAPVIQQRQQPQPQPGKTDLAKRQANEKRLLQQTQSQELKQMQRAQSKEMKSAQNPAEKGKIKQSYQSKSAELQKGHQVERQQMTERHQRETQQAKGGHPASQGKPAEQAQKGKQQEGTAKNPGRR